MKDITLKLIAFTICFGLTSSLFSQKGPKGPKGPKGTSITSVSNSQTSSSLTPASTQNSSSQPLTPPTVPSATKEGSAQPTQGQAATPSFDKKQAQLAVKKAEELRSIDHSESNVDLESFSKDKKENIKYNLKILRSSNLRAYLEFLAPDYERGRHMLAIGKKYWSKFPDSKRVVEISRKEAIGNTAFEMGDLFQIDADKDYDPIDLKKEQDLVKITLISKHPDTTYHKIDYYLTPDSYPVRAKFYGVSDKHIKTMYIEKSGKLAGMIRPTKLKMVDEITPGKYSIWTTKKLTLKQIPDSIFSTSYLKGR